MWIKVCKWQGCVHKNLVKNWTKSGYYSAASYRRMSAANESKAWFRYGTTVGTCNKLQSTISKDNSHRKQHKRNLHLLAGIVVAGILLGNAPSKLTATANATGKVTKMDSAHCRGAKQHTSNHKTKTDVKHQQSSSNVPYQLKVELQICVCGTEQPSCSVTNWHSIKHNPYFPETVESIGKPQLTSTKHVARSTSGDCVHITSELPATIRIEEKIASGIIYISNSQHNLLGLDFIEPLGLLDIPLSFVCNAVSKSLTQSAIRDLTEDILKRFSRVFTSKFGWCRHLNLPLNLCSIPNARYNTQHYHWWTSVIFWPSTRPKNTILR